MSFKASFQKLTLLIFMFGLSTSVWSQTKLSSFQEYYLLSQSNSELYTQELSDLDSMLVSYINEESWSVYDLVTVDSLLYSIHPRDSLKWAICAYIAAQAYSDFDQVVLDSLSRKSYQIFRDLNDSEGAIFAGTLLTEGAVQFEGEHTSDYILSVFDVVTGKSIQTDFPPAKLYQIRCFLESERIRGRTIPEDELDSILVLARKYKDDSPEAYAIVLSGISVHLVLLKEFDRGVKVSHEVLNQALQYSFEDYTCYFNLGAIHYMKESLDSALFYFRRANGLLSRDSSNRVYKLYNSVQVNRGISKVFESKGLSDSALKYLQIAYDNERLYFNNVLDQRRIYGDIKFEAKAALLEAESLALEVAREKKRKELYTLLLILLTITVTTLTIFLLSLRYWVRRYRGLAQNREKILRIINHDLSGSLMMILEYARIKVLDKDHQPPSEDNIQLLSEDFESSICATEQALSNLMSWGMRSPHRERVSDGLLDLRESVDEIRNTLSPLLIPKSVKLDTTKVESEVLRTDIYAFQLILRNLILNAIKHCTPHSIITISGKADGENRVVSIRNRTSSENIEALLAIRELIGTRRDSKRLVLSDGLGYEMINNHLHLIHGELQIQEVEDGVIETLLIVPSMAL